MTKSNKKFENILFNYDTNFWLQNIDKVKYNSYNINEQGAIR